jgi:hypothetical protein
MEVYIKVLIEDLGKIGYELSELLGHDHPVITYVVILPRGTLSKDQLTTVKEVASGRIDDRWVFELGPIMNRRIVILLIVLMLHERQQSYFDSCIP